MRQNGRSGGRTHAGLCFLGLPGPPIISRLPCHSAILPRPSNCWGVFYFLSRNGIDCPLSFNSLRAAARRVVRTHADRSKPLRSAAAAKRLNRLTYAFSKKLENLEAAFAMFAAYYNYCWQSRLPGTSGKKRSTAAMMAGIAGHVWSFDELFDAVLSQ